MIRPVFKCLLYILIAALTALLADLTTFHSFEEISTIKWCSVIINIILQSLIAVRAFLDQAISNHIEPKDEDISN